MGRPAMSARGTVPLPVVADDMPRT